MPSQHTATRLVMDKGVAAQRRGVTQVGQCP
jgi:hypothetical protein